MPEEPTPDPSHLDGFDPYDALDAEAARLEAHLGTLDEDGWAAPSRCSGWTVRDVVAHLAATERYHAACFDGRVATIIEEGMAAGLTSLASSIRPGSTSAPTGRRPRWWRSS